DFNETYAHVASQCAILTYLTKVAKEDLELWQIDIKSAFLNAQLSQPIRMRPPIGFRRKGYVWLLKKAVYGLKQACREWEKTLADFLILMGFERLKGDRCIYRKIDQYLIIYVDDILIASPNKSGIDKLVVEFKNKFKVHEIGEPKRFVCHNLERDRSKKAMYIDQRDYIGKCLLRFNLQSCRDMDRLEKFEPVESSKKSPKRFIQEM